MIKFYQSVELFIIAGKPLSARRGWGEATLVDKEAAFYKSGNLIKII